MAVKRTRGWGDGSLEQLPDGRWKATVVVGRKAGKDGRPTRKRRSKRFTTRAEARRWIGTMQAARHTAGDSDMQLGAWLDQWLADKKQNVTPNTYVWYERRARLHVKPALGFMKLADLRARDVKSWLRDLAAKGVSVGEQRKSLKTLKTALKDAVADELVAGNVAREIRPPKEQTPAAPAEKMKCLDQDGARRFLAAAEADRLSALYRLALDSGMRPGELFALHWIDVDWEAGSVTVCRSLEEIGGKCRLKSTKSGRARVIRLTRQTVEALAEHRKAALRAGRDVKSGLVFVNTEGGYLRISDVRKGYVKLLRKAGLDVRRLYDLRHTSATLQLAAGVDIKTISERLGHTKIQITLDFYSHVLRPMQDRSVQLLEGILAGPPAPAAPAPIVAQQ